MALLLSFAGRTVPIAEGESVPVGRASSKTRQEEAHDNLFFRNPVVSRRHATVSMFNGSLYLTDLGSTHGTRYASHRTKPYALEPDTKQLLTDGAVLHLGADVVKETGTAADLLVGDCKLTPVELFSRVSGTLGIKTAPPTPPRTREGRGSASYGLLADDSGESEDEQSAEHTHDDTTEVDFSISDKTARGDAAKLDVEYDEDVATPATLQIGNTPAVVEVLFDTVTAATLETGAAIEIADTAVVQQFETHELEAQASDLQGDVQVVEISPAAENTSPAISGFVSHVSSPSVGRKAADDGGPSTDVAGIAAQELIIDLDGGTTEIVSEPLCFWSDSDSDSLVLRDTYLGYSSNDDEEEEDEDDEPSEYEYHVERPGALAGQAASEHPDGETEIRAPSLTASEMAYMDELDLGGSAGAIASINEALRVSVEADPLLTWSDSGDDSEYSLEEDSDLDADSMSDSDLSIDRQSADVLDELPPRVREPSSGSLNEIRYVVELAVLHALAERDSLEQSPQATIVALESLEARVLDMEERMNTSLEQMRSRLSRSMRRAIAKTERTRVEAQHIDDTLALVNDAEVQGSNRLSNSLKRSAPCQDVDIDFLTQTEADDNPRGAKRVKVDDTASWALGLRNTAFGMLLGMGLTFGGLVALGASP